MSYFKWYLEHLETSTWNCREGGVHASEEPHLVPHFLLSLSNFKWKLWGILHDTSDTVPIESSNIYCNISRYTCINHAGLRVTVICTCCPNSHLIDRNIYLCSLLHIMTKQTIKHRKSACGCTTKELKQNIMYGNTMQGWWHCLSHDPKPDLDTNPGSISHDISRSTIHTSGKVKEEWPSVVGKGGE